MKTLIAPVRIVLILCPFIALCGCVTLVEPEPVADQPDVQAQAPVTAPTADDAQPADVDVAAQVSEPPPPLPDYQQPPCPGDGWLWTPGYWSYGSDGYYWVPGTWVLPPRPGLLWTPGYWGFAAGLYVFHPGYWARHVGFYGGVDYGFGYSGAGYEGGRWDGDRFVYNRAITNVNVRVVHNTYYATVVHNVVVNRVSYNGGRGGTFASPSERDRAAAMEPHLLPTDLQRQHGHEAARNPALVWRHGRDADTSVRPHPEAFGPPGTAEHDRGRVTSFPHGPDAIPARDAPAIEARTSDGRNTGDGRNTEARYGVQQRLHMNGPKPVQVLHYGRGSMPLQDTHRASMPPNDHARPFDHVPQANGGQHPQNSAPVEPSRGMPPHVAQTLPRSHPVMSFAPTARTGAGPAAHSIAIHGRSPATAPAAAANAAHAPHEKAHPDKGAKHQRN